MDLFTLNNIYTVNDKNTAQLNDSETRIELKLTNRHTIDEDSLI